MNHRTDKLVALRAELRNVVTEQIGHLAAELAEHCHDRNYWRCEVWPDGARGIREEVNRDTRTVLPDNMRDEADRNIQPVQCLAIVGTGSISCDCDACRNGAEGRDRLSDDDTAEMESRLLDALDEIGEGYWLKSQARNEASAKNHAAAAVLADFPAAGRSDEQVSKEPRVNGVGPAIFDNSACLPPHADPATVGRATPAMAQSKRVLVVDDDPAILRAVSRELKAAGWQVDTRTEPGWMSAPDVLLADWDPHGPLTTESARKLGVPFVVMTGNDALVLPGVAIVRKPWQPGDLDSVLREAVRK